MQFLTDPDRQLLHLGSNTCAVDRVVDIFRKQTIWHLTFSDNAVCRFCKTRLTSFTRKSLFLHTLGKLGVALCLLER